jgi:hypothetical protein
MVEDSGTVNRGNPRRGARVRAGRIATRWKVVAAVALLFSAAMCYLPTDLDPLGGGWYTHYSSGWSMDSQGRTALYRRGLFGRSVRVDDNIYLRRFYPPDCVVYEPQRDVGQVYAGCGHHAPVPVAFFPPWQMNGQFEEDDGGLHRIDTVRVVNGHAIATVVRIPIDSIRKAANSRPMLHPGWASTAPREPVVRPVVRDEPVDVHAIRRGGVTPLIDAVRTGQRDVVDALLRDGADVDARDSLGTTALQMAVGTFDTDTAIVRRLLDAGASPNVVDNTRATPLLRASIAKDTAIFRVLLAKGADPCLSDDKGRTILDFAGDEFPVLQRMAKDAMRRCSSARP